MTHLGDAGDVGAGAVRAGADDQRTGGIGMLVPGLFDLLRRGRMRKVALGVPAGVIQRGCTPEKISPATIDLWLSRPTSRLPWPPATAIIAARTDRELPQVENQAISAPTASAIRSSARCR